MKTLCCEYLEPLLGCWQPSGLHTRSGYFSGLCDSWLQRTAFPCPVCFNQSPTGMWPLEWHNPFPETRFLFQEQLWSGNIPRCFLGKMVEVRSPAMLWWQKQIQVFCGIIKTYRWHGYGWLFLEIHSCTCCTEVGFSTVVVEIKSHVCLIRSPTPQPPKLRWRNILFHGNCTSCGCQCLTSCLRLTSVPNFWRGLVPHRRIWLNQTAGGLSTFHCCPSAGGFWWDVFEVQPKKPLGTSKTSGVHPNGDR